MTMATSTPPMEKLDLARTVHELLDGRSLYDLTPEEQHSYWAAIAPYTQGTTSEITDGKEHDSAVRQNMAGNHIGQGVPTILTGNRLFWNGPERNYGKACYSESLQKDCDILAVIPRYTGYNQLNLKSPYDLVIYELINENGSPGEIGFFLTKGVRRKSLKFGYHLDFSEVAGNLRPGHCIPKEMVIGRNNAVSKEGDFQYGHECNIAFMTDSRVSEDQYMISSDVPDRFAFYLHNDKRIPYPRDSVALDLYGRGDRYQPFPLPGQRVRSDGLLMAFRKLNNDHAWIDCTRNGLRRVYDGIDRRIHVDQSMVGYAEVVDVEVTRGQQRRAKNVLSGTTDILEELAALNEDFYGRVVKEYQRLRNNANWNNLNLTNEFTRYLAVAMIKSRHTEHNFLPKLREMADRMDSTVRNVPIGDYVVDFELVARKKPFTGDKFSDTHGTKGVASAPVPKEHMPAITLPNGTKIIADFALSWVTVAKRMNSGQMYTFEVCYYKDWVLDHIKPEYENGNWKYCWEQILKLYDCVSPYAAKAIASILDTPERRKHHVDCCMNKGLVFFNPNHEGRLWSDKVAELKAAFPYVRRLPVTFTGRDGVQKTTVMPAKIATKVMLLLEKHPEVIAAGTSSRQHFGQPVMVTKETRNEHQIKKQSVRGMSETEGQAWLGAAGQEFAAESFDRTTNILTNQMLVDNIIEAIAPTSVANLVDRVAIPLGSSKTIAMLNNTVNSMGWTLEHNINN